MDETLIHFDQDSPMQENDLLKNVAYRPYLEKFLRTLVNYYELVIFTSAL